MTRPYYAYNNKSMGFGKFIRYAENGQEEINLELFLKYYGRNYALSHLSTKTTWFLHENHNIINQYIQERKNEIFELWE